MEIVESQSQKMGMKCSASTGLCALGLFQQELELEVFSTFEVG
jgi:hypothetical protein